MGVRSQFGQGLRDKAGNGLPNCALPPILRGVPMVHPAAKIDESFRTNHLAATVQQANTLHQIMLKPLQNKRKKLSFYFT